MYISFQRKSVRESHSVFDAFCYVCITVLHQVKKHKRYVPST